MDARTASPRLATEGLGVGFDGKVVVEDVRIALVPGEIVCLVGPNGSGKSTVLKSISRQIPPVCGHVYLDGRDVSGLGSGELARKLGVMLTGHVHTEMLTCLDVVETGRHPHTGRLGILGEEDRRQIRAAMELVDAWELRDRDFMRVSDGQRQRILLARAICQEPSVMILDEPTSFLDVRYQLDLLNVLKGLARDRSMAAVVTLHELTHAQKVADRVLCIRDGRVFAYGTPEEVLTRKSVGELFSLGGGSYNPAFGNVEDDRPDGAPRVFVLAGGGLAAASMRALRRAGVAFCAGILPQSDADWFLARDLTPHAISVPAFEPVREDAVGAALDVLKTCEALVDCLGSHLGTQNDLCRHLPAAARELGIPVFGSAADYLASKRDGVGA